MALSVIGVSLIVGGYVFAKADRLIGLGEVRDFIYLPLVRQSTNYTCGVAAVQSVVTFFGSAESESDLARELHPDPENGTPVGNVVNFFNARGFQTSVREPMSLRMLEEAVGAGRPTMVLLQAWAGEPGEPIQWEKTWDSGHWVVVIGYDRENIYFMDPFKTAQYTFIEREEFLRRWHDVDAAGRKYIHFGLTVWKKGGRPSFNFHDIVPMN